MEETIMSQFWKKALLSAILVVPIATVPATLRAEDHRDEHRYHDRDHKDDHVWNNHEDKAYRIWAKENHRKYRNFEKLREQDRQSYWAWRHNHSDSLLRIDIR
jgi:hypothetical protein